MNTFRQIFFFFLFISINTVVFGQNLVKNPGFELNSGIPTGAGQYNLIQDWTLPLGSAGTPDYFSSFYSGQPNTCNSVGIPNNFTGFCDPLPDGENHYVGISFDPTVDLGRGEYITSKLKAPLIPGEFYFVEFKIQAADSLRYLSSGIGALFTKQSPTQTGTDFINTFPNIERILFILNDNQNWMSVAQTYQASLTAGGEEYITIGSFRSVNDSNLKETDLGSNNSGCSQVDNKGYYLIDNITVRPVTPRVNIVGDIILCPGETTVLTADCNLPYWWSSSAAPLDTLSLDSAITVTPGGPISYYLNTETITESVDITFVNPPVVNLIPDTFLCETDSILLDGTAPDGIQYYWSTGETTPTIYARDTGVYVVTVDNTGCSTTDTVIIPGYLDNPPVPWGEDSLYCFFYYDTLRLDAGEGIFHSWLLNGLPDGNGRQYTITRPGLLSVTVIRPNNCIRSRSMEVAESCDPVIFVPSAFTPDDDGINDFFKPFVNNVLSYNFRIYNSRGQEIFYSEDSELGWDGTYKGVDSPIGVYAWRINFMGLDEEGIKVKKKVLGTVTLLR
jgi:gliding motility-associated-like protein